MKVFNFLSSVFLSLTLVVTAQAAMSKQVLQHDANAKFPKKICRRFFSHPSFAATLKLNKINHVYCLQLMSVQFNHCYSRMQRHIPRQLSDAQATQWQGKLVDCAASDFGSDLKYLSKLTFLSDLVESYPHNSCEYSFSLPQNGEALHQNAITEPFCEKWTRVSLNYCIRQHQRPMPKILDSHQQKTWGQRLGNCATKHFVYEYATSSRVDFEKG